ncbi:hypothetical protein FPQ18DRAFT_368074 [Pyronema domesticum]|nr:hypothetical protein FPQ18DRAFT_368074 [Pyronema domesticum]
MSTSLTPSPSPPNSGVTSGSRRPARKSTLTQQQKNQKRQRATQEQLVTLEAEFNKNPTPTATVRLRIANEINMTERSVQIWFQNRRAKIKTLAKKSIETGEDCDAIPECMRQYLAIQAMENGKGGYGYMDRSRMSAYGNGSMLMQQEPQPQGKIVIHHLSCRSLSIGSWRRVGQNTMDLIVFYSPEKASLTYYINNDQAGYKIEFPFSYIKDINLETHPDVTASGQKTGHLVITLNRPPNFYMDSSGSGGFFQCADFTEDQQASQVLMHYLGGHPKVLAGQLAKLVTLEAYANRHAHAMAPFHMFDHQIPMSAPVSPHIVRPASAQDISSWSAPEVAPGHNFHQKHRRTRSRSVPIAIDFSQMQGSMPSFNFQEHHDQGQHLYAPAPMHPHSLVTPVLSNPLRIDTTPGFIDYRPGSTGYPLSATTAGSPSDYASPSMLSSALHYDPNGAHGTPYSLPFLSPMQAPQNGVGQSISPISNMGDPIIASGSPPLSHIDRSASAELFPSSYDHNGSIPDDLTELYSKQSLSMHHDSPHHMDDHENVDMQQLLHYPMGLSPEHVNV